MIETKAGDVAQSRPRPQALERKIAAYAVASGAMLIGANHARAEIVYSGIRDVPVGNQQTVNLNVNDTGPLADSIDDFTLRHTNTISGLNQTLTLAITGLGSNEFVVTSDGFAAALNSGDEISASDLLGGGTKTMATYKLKLNSIQSSAGPWRGANDKFLGLAFDIPGSGTHFGWARVSVTTDPTALATAVIHDWAYETQTGASIRAGARAVPEPSSLALLALGAAGVAAVKRARSRA